MEALSKEFSVRLWALVDHFAIRGLSGNKKEELRTSLSLAQGTGLARTVSQHPQHFANAKPSPTATRERPGDAAVRPRGGSVAPHDDFQLLFHL